MTDQITMRDEVNYLLGIMLSKATTATKATPPPSPFSYALLAQEIASDLDLWEERVRAFVTAAGGVTLHPVVHRIMQPIKEFRHELLKQSNPETGTKDQYKQTNVKIALDTCLTKVRKQIAAVPLGWSAVQDPKHSPLTVYFRIREALATATTRVHYFDRYLTPDFFHMYMRVLDRSLEIKLITTQGSLNKGYGSAAVATLAKRALIEYPKFELRELHQSEFHERNLLIDNNPFFLGNGVEDAGNTPNTFAPGDGSPGGLITLESLLNKSTVVPL